MLYKNKLGHINIPGPRSQMSKNMKHIKMYFVKNKFFFEGFRPNGLQNRIQCICLHRIAWVKISFDDLSLLLEMLSMVTVMVTAMVTLINTSRLSQAAR